MKFFRLQQIFPILLLLGFQSSLASGVVYIDIGKAQVKKSLLALPPFQFYGSQTKKSHLQFGQELFSVVSNDLEISSYFTFS